jgi:hypothetical protein
MVDVALRRIDSEIQDLSAEANRLNPGFTPQIRVRAWQMAYDALKKRYP